MATRNTGIRSYAVQSLHFLLFPARLQDKGNRNKQCNQKPKLFCRFFKILFTIFLFILPQVKSRLFWCIYWDAMESTKGREKLGKGVWIHTKPGAACTFQSLDETLIWPSTSEEKNNVSIVPRRSGIRRIRLVICSCWSLEQWREQEN